MASNTKVTLERTLPSIPAMFFQRAKQTPNLTSYRYREGNAWKEQTWKETEATVRDWANGLLALGIKKGQTCGLLATTRIEWVFADTAIVCAGGATTTIYPSNTAEECAYILADSDSVCCFAENEEQVEKLKSQRSQIPNVAHVVVFDGEGDGDWVISAAELVEKGKAFGSENPGAIDDVVATLEREDLATLVYTSGTTGRPKGVRLPHDCWTYEADAMKAIGILHEDDVQLLWLPLAHCFGKVLLVGQYTAGYVTAIDGDIPSLIDNLAVVRPTFMAAAPRIFEKVYNKVIAGAKEAGGVKYKLFKWAVKTGQEVSKLRQQGQEPSGALALKYGIANKLVFSKIKAKFGGKVRFFVSGSAPLSKDIAEFFHAADILILEGYGLTESSAASYINLPNRFRFGTVGFPLPGTEVKLAEEDSEILLRGPGIMRGYHNMPEESAKTLSKDGWLHTGDIGEFDDAGFLKITDRKKDLIKTSGGKYIAPQLLEGRFKAICPLASQVIVHGDKRNYCSALLTLDEEALLKWGTDNGRQGKSYQELTEDPGVIAVVQEYINELNGGLASYETVKKFRLLPKDLTVEEGELTPSLKVKRKHVEKKYASLLDEMYEGALTEI